MLTRWLQRVPTRFYCRKSIFGHFPIEITIENFKWPVMDRFWVYNAEKFLWAPLTQSHHISRSRDEIKKSCFAEHPNAEGPERAKNDQGQPATGSLVRPSLELSRNSSTHYVLRKSTFGILKKTSQKHVKLFFTIEIRHIYFWKGGDSYLHIYTMNFLQKRRDSNVWGFSWSLEEFASLIKKAQLTLSVQKRTGLAQGSQSWCSLFRRGPDQTFRLRCRASAGTPGGTLKTDISETIPYVGKHLTCPPCWGRHIVFVIYKWCVAIET